jgi:hypothetical protein
LNRNAAGRIGSGQPGAIGNAEMNRNTGGINRNPWFGDPSVRQQLNLNDDQFNRLNQSYLDNFNRFDQSRGQLGNELNEQQRAQRMRELEGSFRQGFSSSLNDVFTSPQQRQRFEQLELQHRGLGALSDPTMQQRLNLTPDQRRQIQDLATQWNTEMGRLGNSARTDTDATTRNFNTMRLQMSQRINSILNDQQRQVWSQMVGEPFDFPASAFFQQDPTTGTPGSSRNAERRDATKPATGTQPRR